MIKDLTKKLIEKFSVEIKEPENMTKIKDNFIDPLIIYTTLKLYPYFLIIVILFLIVSIFSLINFLLLLKIYYKKKYNLVL